MGSRPCLSPRSYRHLKISREDGSQGSDVPQNLWAVSGCGGERFVSYSVLADRAEVGHALVGNPG